METEGTSTANDMKIIITDTNVFFDVISINALPEFFGLDFEICTTDFVVNEILLTAQKEQIEFFIRSRKLTVFQLAEDDVDEIKAFKTVRFFRGITDKTVLWKAIKLKCPLLTGDKKLKNEAKDQGVEVHGSIWIVIELVEKEIITKGKGIELLKLLMEVNGSLPHDEIEKLIRQYQQ
jgi:rRNA-processing protein FCF1